MGNDPRYSKSRCFDPFPFPDRISDNLKEKMRLAAEELDATRKRVLNRHPDLTLTKLYNALERAAPSRRMIVRSLYLYGQGAETRPRPVLCWKGRQSAFHH
jgi:hypothetical protein